MIYAFITFVPNTFLIGKKTLLKSEIMILQISHLFFGCCGQSNIYLNFLLLSLSSPFIWTIWTRIKWWTRLEFLYEIFGCGENERQSSEILTDLAPIALNQKWHCWKKMINVLWWRDQGNVHLLSGIKAVNVIRIIDLICYDLTLIIKVWLPNKRC